MASGRGRGKDARVTDEQLKEVEYELQRNKSVEENKRKLASVLQTKYGVSEEFNARRTQKQKKGMLMNKKVVSVG
jgi:hypothetical protein